MNDALLLSYEGKALREFDLGDRALDIGRSRHCDIVVHDAALPDRAYVVERSHDGVQLVDLGARRRVSFPLGASLPLGRHHELQRIRSERTPLPAGRTEPLGVMPGPEVPLGLVIGRGSETRHVSLDGRPLTVGSDPARNEVVLADRAVSATHCRIEPMGGRALVRDLDSRNGTWLAGRRVHSVEVGPGARIRVGRTDLRLVARGGGQRAPLVVESAPMRAVMEEVERFARVRGYCVLVTGESGAGKEGVARALHTVGPRSEGPFVAYNGAGLSDQLVASRLFGHERGAFTGADAAHRGAFEQADGGTLFLDEVGELPLTTQARLLRVLETWEVRRLGSERLRKVDLRLVTATNRDLREEVRRGTFREDLFYRLMQLWIHVPPLRDRRADIAPLARHFVEEVARDLGAPRSLSAKALERLERHEYPGNVRELRNLVLQAAVAAPTERIGVAEVARALERVSGVITLEAEEPDQYREALDQHEGNLSAAARALGIPRSTLRDRLKRSGTY